MQSLTIQILLPKKTLTCCFPKALAYFMQLRAHFGKWMLCKEQQKRRNDQSCGVDPGERWWRWKGLQEVGIWFLSAVGYSSALLASDANRLHFIRMAGKVMFFHKKFSLIKKLVESARRKHKEKMMTSRKLQSFEKLRAVRKHQAQKSWGDLT